MNCKDIRAKMMAAAEAGDEVACTTAALALAAKKARGGDYFEASAIKDIIDGDKIGYRRVVAGVKAKLYRAAMCNAPADEERHLFDMLARAAVADIVAWMSGKD